MQLSQITKVALDQAKIAKLKKEVPIGAVVFSEKKIISKAYNQILTKNDPLAHAEIIALKKASKKLLTNNLTNLMLYVTLEPCIICCYAISKFKIGSLYFGSYDSKNGSIQNGEKIFLKSKNIYKPKVYGGIAAKESEALIKEFFRNLRKNS